MHADCTIWFREVLTYKKVTPVTRFITNRFLKIILLLKTGKLDSEQINITTVITMLVFANCLAESIITSQKISPN